MDADRSVGVFVRAVHDRIANQLLKRHAWIGHGVYFSIGCCDVHFPAVMRIDLFVYTTQDLAKCTVDRRLILDWISHFCQE